MVWWAICSYSHKENRAASIEWSGILQEQNSLQVFLYILSFLEPSTHAQSSVTPCLLLHICTVHIMCIWLKFMFPQRGFPRL